MLAVESSTVDADAHGRPGTVDAHSFVTVVPNQGCGGAKTQVQCQETEYNDYSCGRTCLNFCRTSDAPGCTVN